MKRHGFATILLTVAVLALLGTAGQASEKKLKRTYQVMGKVSDCGRSYVMIDDVKYYLTPETRLYSQAHKRISLTDICRGGLVNIAYYRIGRNLVAGRIKFLDMIGSAQYKTISGKIKSVSRGSLYLGGSRIFLDEFTIRLGDVVQSRDLRNWLGVDLTVIALKNDAGMWVAEIIREGADITSLYDKTTE